MRAIVIDDDYLPDIDAVVSSLKKENLLNQKKDRDSVRRKLALKKYDMSLEDYDKLFAFQGGVCAICGKPEPIQRSVSEQARLCVDHCHKTGMVRGLLCRRCNTAIGMMGDDIAALAKAISYLEGFKTNGY